MADFLLELLTEEIPARMQAAAAVQLHNRLSDGLTEAALEYLRIELFVTPRRLCAIIHGIGLAGDQVTVERRGPRTDAPEQAIAGFVKSTGLARDALEERDTPKGRFLYATVVTPGRSAAAVLAELVPAIVRDFDWPKSMRWGAASATTASPRWVRPLSGVVALLDDAIVPFEAAGVTSGRSTFGHRFMSSGPVEIASAATYAGQLRTAHVMLDAAERGAVIVKGATAVADAAGLRLIPDDGLVAENAGLTEWPVPLLGHFDSAFLDVPPEVIQLTMRTNQKYFACASAGANESDGALAPAFVAVANLEAADGGAGIVAGNAKVLAARLADAKFFWDADRSVTLESRLPKLEDIVFHEKLGTVADKVERVAKLARWLIESGAVPPSPSGEGRETMPLHRPGGGAVSAKSQASAMQASATLESPTPDPSPEGEERHVAVAELAALAETAARLCKADLVSATVGEFPEVQGIAGGRLALAEGLDPRIAAAIRDHYKPVGPSDEVPTAPVTVAVALADKLDTFFQFFLIQEFPTGSRDPFALRRQALGVLALMGEHKVRVSLLRLMEIVYRQRIADWRAQDAYVGTLDGWYDSEPNTGETYAYLIHSPFYNDSPLNQNPEHRSIGLIEYYNYDDDRELSEYDIDRSKIIEIARFDDFSASVLDFLADRLKVQQREAGIRPDVIDAVFSLGGEDDLVRLVSRAKALQAFLQTPNGVNLLAGYRRGANIVRIEEGRTPGVSDGEVDATLLTESGEVALSAALDAAVPEAAAAVAAENFTGAMTALARLRPAVDAFFEHVTVNAHEANIRRNRLALLARLRTAVHSVADFSRIEG